MYIKTIEIDNALTQDPADFQEPAKKGTEYKIPSDANTLIYGTSINALRLAQCR